MPLFRNYYRCARCHRTWTDEWSATCDDDCPHCGARHMAPFKSETVEQDNGLLASTARIRTLNDAFRTTFQGGQVVMTASVAALPDCVKAHALLKVTTFDEFTQGQ